MRNLAVVRAPEESTIQLPEENWPKVFETIKYFDGVLNGGTMPEDMNADGYSMFLPLCQDFFPGTPVCNGCPIREYTGRSFCKDTPLDEMIEHWDDYHNSGGFFTRPDRTNTEAIIVECNTCRRLIKEEIAFLKGLFFGQDQRKSRLW